MRLSFGAALIALAPVVLGWKVTLYDNTDCNDQSDNFSYYVVTGEGGMDYCVGMLAEADEIPSNVHCSYFTDKGKVGPLPCDGQIKEAWSFKVFRGVLETYGAYDTSKMQPIYHRCFERNFDLEGDGDEDGFHYSSPECRNAYVRWDGKNFDAEIHGYRVWEYTGKDSPE